MLVRIYHESQGKPTYVVKEIQPAAEAEDREPALPACRLTRRVLFLTESFHPVLGGGEQHILRLGARAGRVRDAGHGGHAPRRTRGWPARGDASTASASCASGPPGPARRGQVRDGAGRAAPRAATAARALRRARRPRHARARPARRSWRRARWASAVVLQAEVNGEMTGEVYTWGTRARPRLAAARGLRPAVAARNRAAARRATPSWPCRARSATSSSAAGVPPREGRAHPARRGHRAASGPPTPGRARWRCGGASACPRTAGSSSIRAGCCAGKGLETLLEAFAADRGRRGPRAHLVIVGSGDGPVALRRGRAARRAARAAAWPAASPSPAAWTTVEDWLRASDVFAFPSDVRGARHLAGRGRGLRPARVASRTGGIVGRRGGRPVRLARAPGDVAALLDRARIAWSRTRTSRREMGAAARAVGARAVRRARHRRPLSRAVPRGGGTGRPAVRIALTGATGYTGGRLLARLRADGHQVAALARAGARAPAGGGRRRPVGRRRPRATRARCERLVEGADAVVHVAAVYRTAGHPDSYYRDVNVGGTERLLEAAARAGVRRFVHTSTVGVHGDVKEPARGRDRAHRAGRHLPADQGRGGGARARATTGGAACPWPWCARPPSTARGRRAC